MNLNKTLISLVTKYPDPGIAKTRLSKSIGSKLAIEVSLSLIIDFVAILRNEFINLHIETDSTESRDKFIKIFPDITINSENSDNAIQRVDQVFKKNINLFEKVICVFSDVPYLTAEIIKNAENSLDLFDIVLGPDDGGGCFLFGMKDYYNVFEFNDNRAYFPCLIKNAAKISNKVNILDALFDLDVVSDIKKISPAKMALLRPTTLKVLVENKLL